MSVELVTEFAGGFNSKRSVYIKAEKVLGRDHSREKLMSTLGIASEELEIAEKENFKRSEQILERERAIEPCNKRETLKAREVLGYDPSIKKIMNTLGVDENIVEEAKQEALNRQDEVHKKKRKNSANLDKKHIKKALDVLGHNPSLEKVIQTLGIDDSDLERMQQEKIEEYEEDCKRQRKNSWANKKESQKALRILGVDISKEKAGETLGICEIDLAEAESDRMERETQLIVLKKNKANEDRINKKNISKALRVLGHDPSDLKAAHQLGVEIETVLHERHALQSTNENGTASSSHNVRNGTCFEENVLNYSKSVFISSTGVLVASVFVYLSFYKDL